MKKKEEKVKKEKRVRIKRIGTHKKSVMFLWMLLIGSVAFGVYKNFTAIHTRTIEKEKIIQEKIVDTHAVESFVDRFAREYFSWVPTEEALNARQERLGGYMTEALKKLNVDAVRKDIPTSSSVRMIQIWRVERVKGQKSQYRVVFSVEQWITEGGIGKTVTAAYQTTVYVEENGSMVILKNPTMARVPQKSGYQPPEEEVDGRVSGTEQQEITEFLNTFFRLYPKASEKELAYYVKDGMLEPVGKDYVFSELLPPICRKEGKKIKVSLSVKFLDNETKVTQISQYELTLKKSTNWLIVDVK